MTETSRPLPRSAWIGYSLVFGLIGLGIFVSILQHAKQQKMDLPVIGPVADFTLTNQDEKVTTLADFTNHVWLADIVFTRCAGPCPRMTQQMKSVEDQLPKDGAARLVTLTTDPEFDTPEQMKRFGEHYDADFSRWTFLTGGKMQIGLLAANSLKLGSEPVKPEDQTSAADLFIHTTIFAIVDKHARMRGSFETGGDGVDWTNDVLPKIIATVHQLEEEP